MTDSWKNIDQTFKGKFNNFEVEPPAHVWANIQSEIGSGSGNPPIKGNGGGLSSLLLFVVVFILVSFISPKSTLEVSDDMESVSLFVSDDLYYSSDSDDIGVTDVESAKPLNEELASDRKVDVKIIENTPVVMEENLAIIPETNTTDKVIGVEPEALSGIEDMKKLKQIEASLLQSGIANREVAEIMDRPLIPNASEKGKLQRKVKGDWLMGVSFAPEVVFFNQNDDFTNQRYSGGLDVLYKKKPFIFQTGLQVLKTKDVGELKFDYEKYIGSYEDVVNITFDTIGGELIPTYHTETVDVYDSITHSYYSPLESDYYYLQIPLLAGYEIEQRRITWSLVAGPTLSFLLSEKSNYFTPADLEDDNIISREYQTPKRLNTSMQVMLLAGMRYKLSRHLSFSFQPMMRYNLTSIYEKNAVSTNHPYSIGIKTGVLIDF